jgi:hypothetical protein
MRMRTKRTSNNVRPVELPPLFHRGTRTPNIERRHDGLNFIFDVGSSEFDVRCFRSSRHSQRGVALIITLILLSVVTFMAITFLALSRRERSAVTTVTDTASARLAADAALANAEAQVIANVLATTNPYNFSLLVSTNGWPLNFTNLPRDLTNLYVSPRAPVFIPNPTNSSLPPDFRFYLDLNRNGRFDGNGLVPETNNLNLPTGIINFMVGDPEWIGVLERPDAPYGPNNKFLARYAFIAVPVGNALDLNAIHNQAHWPQTPSGPLPAVPSVNPSSTGNRDNFVRNEGVGSWEINLAAFLTDLNTNEWDNSLSGIYQYPQSGFNNPVAAFDDARALLANRYNNNFKSLSSVKGLYGAPNATIFSSDHIDGYTYGQFLIGVGVTGFQLPRDSDSALNGVPNPPSVVGSPWVGADNTNHFFTHQELFDPAKTELGATTPGFVERLQQAGTNVSTYDRYTFYRLLSQLGTDSTPDAGKMNLNYDNVNPYLNGFPNTNGVAASTNFVAWQPLAFFTNAADRMLRAYTTHWRNSNPTNFAATFYSVTNFNFNATNFASYPAFGIGNIPVWVSNRFVYSPAMNRLLQLAANMYDADYYTNNYVPPGASYSGAYLPTVFKPVFTVTNGNVYITNFVEVTNTSFLANMNRNLGFGPTVVNALQPDDLVFGVPLIIGAKKGFPNFNEFALESAFQLTRKLQVTRTATNAPSSSYKYNQMFILSVTNQLGVEFWNSYNNNYTRPVVIYVTNYVFMTLTNDANYSTSLVMILTNSIQIQPWQGYNPKADPVSAPFSFQIPLNTNVAFVPNSMYRFNGGSPYLTTNLNLPYEIIGTNYQPHWGMTMTNLLQVVMVDTASGRIVDYVQLSGPNSIRDLTGEIQKNEDIAPYLGFSGLWETNLNNGVPAGYGNQVGVSLGLYGDHDARHTWNQMDQTLVQNEIDGFRAWYSLGPIFNNAGAQQAIALAKATNDIQAPYTPTATAVEHVTWQANDPLVHYIASDLNWSGADNLDRNINWPGNLGHLNDRYLPWGGNPIETSADVQDAYNSALKDPLVSSSDFWDFPTNKFPTVGWLGRVHRGTPWQTVYLKAVNIATNSDDPNLGINAWMTWTGNFNPTNAPYTAPVQDRLLFDLFTTAFNDNATRGQLSVNVGPTNANLAAWSALFSGIVVPPTSLTNPYTIISPVGTLGAGSPLWQLVNGTNGINSTRANTNLFPRQVFTHVGDILAVPALTEQSPFLNLANTSYNNDEMYEWLPQQTMSLLRVSGSPRYVIYCYGQALKPAPNSIYTGGGQFFGMVTNYQVVSEIATRAVVRFNSTVTNNVVLDVNNNWVGRPVVTNNNAVIESFNILPPD